MTLLRGLIRAMALVKIIILARFLLPAQFGAYGIVMVVFGLFEILTETGINIALIQEDDDIDDFISTAWIVSILRGLAIAGVLYAIAPFISHFFKSRETLDMIRFVSLVPLVRGFINPAIIKFQKKLAFHKEFWFRFCIYFIDTACAVTAGVIMRSAYALLWGMLASAIVEVIISFLVVRPRPALHFNLDKAQIVMSRGKWITLAGIFDYLFSHLNDIAIGRFLGIAPLGFYQQAYRISTLSIVEVGEIFNKVTFPSYVHIAHDQERLKKAFLKMTVVISLIVIPFGLLLFLFAQKIVFILLGEKWLGAMSALKVLAIFGILKALSNSTYSLFLSVGKQKVITFITLVGIVGLALPLLPFIYTFGIVGAGYAALAGTLAGLPFIIYYLRRIFSCGYSKEKKLIRYN